MTYYESEKFSDFSLHWIFESKNFRFPFLYETWPILGSKNVKNKLRKIVENLADKLRNEWYGHLEIFSRHQVLEISRQYLLLRTYIQKTVVGCPFRVSVSRAALASPPN